MIQTHQFYECVCYPIIFVCIHLISILRQENLFNSNKFIRNCKAIIHEFSQNINKKFNSVKDFQFLYDTDRYIIE